MTIVSPLVSTDWLQAHRHDPNLVLLDASVYLRRAGNDPVRQEFLSGHDAFLSEGHLPGARFADLFEQFSDGSVPLPFTRPSAGHFAQAASRLGITPDSHVVIYDSLVGQWAARLWWVFHSFGHAAVSVLDGGLRKYVAEGSPLETGPQQPVAPASYPEPTVTQRYASLDDVAAIVDGRAQGRLVCFLLPADYQGDVAVRRRAGHIPGSVNIPFTELIDGQTNALLPAPLLRSKFESLIDLQGPAIITYCGGGVASALGSLALAAIGCNNTAEFDGSLAEWVQDAGRPVRVGPDLP